MDDQTLNIVRAAARTGTSRRHIQAIVPGADLDQIAQQLQHQDGETDTPLDWKTWATRERERYKLARKTRKLNNND